MVNYKTLVAASSMSILMSMGLTSSAFAQCTECALYPDRDPLNKGAQTPAGKMGLVQPGGAAASPNAVNAVNNQNNNPSHPYGLYPPPFAGGALPPIGGRIGGFGGQGKMLPPQPPPVQAVPLPAIELPPLPERKKG